MLADFEKRNYTYRSIFCGVRMPLTLAFGILGLNHFLFFLGQIAIAWAGKHRPDLSLGLTRGVCLGEIAIVILSLASLLYFSRSEYFNAVFKMDLPGSVVTGMLFSSFFVFVVAMIFLKSGFRDTVVDSYRSDLIANAGDTGNVSKIMFGADIFLSSIYEELIFRSLLLKSFANRFGMLPANILVSLMFVALHFIYHDITPASVAGWSLLSFACGIANFKTNGWVAPSIVHIVYNSRFFLIAPIFV